MSFRQKCRGFAKRFLLWKVVDDNDDDFFCGMVDRQKAFGLISSRGNCQRSSPSWISNMPRAGFEPAQNLSSGLIEWTCAVVIITTPRGHILKGHVVLRPNNTPSRRLEKDVQFTMSWRRLIYVVLKTSNLRRLKEVWFTTSWRRVNYDVLKTSVKRRLCSNIAATSI